MIKTLSSVLSKKAKRRLGKESFLYHIGASIYRFCIHLFKRLGLSARFYEDDLVLLQSIIRQSLNYAPQKDGKHIVFLSLRGWSVHLSFEAILAARLRMEGHRITFLSCFDSLPICMYGSINHLPEERRNCNTCMSRKNALWSESFDVEYLPSAKDINVSVNNLVEGLDLKGCQNFEYDGSPYGELVHRGVVWFLRKSRLSDTDLDTYRTVLLTAHTVRRGLEDFLSRTPVDTVVMLNGDFFCEKVASWVFRQKSIPFITHDYTFHERLAVAVNRSVWDDLSFEDKQQPISASINDKDRKKAKAILRHWRKTGGYQGNLFWSKNTLKDAMPLHKKFKLDDRPLAVAYTNMTFESSVISKNRVFQDQFHWLDKLIDFFDRHNEFQLIIRTHPAEVRQSYWRPRESLYHFLDSSFPALPDNIKIIAPDEKVSSYAIGLIANVILVYSSTLGMEMADRNKCVITAAHVHYANRGFTLDPDSENDYFVSLQNVMQDGCPFTKKHRQCLVDYVAWLFYHRLTPFEATGNIQVDWPQVNIANLNEFKTRHFPGVQKVTRLVADGHKWW